MENKLQLTDFDCITCGSYFQMLKGYIPFIPPDKQSTVAIFIRMAELIWTVEFYKNGPSPALRREAGDIKDIIRELRPCCAGKDLEILETFSNFGNISEIMEMYKKAGSGSPDILSSVLSPSQKEMYEKYRKILNC